MTVTVMIHFPIAAEKNDRLLAERPELIDPIIELLRKHGAGGHSRLLGEDEYIDFDEFPSREAYAAFKSEAEPLIRVYEDALGIRSVDTVWDPAQGEQ